jgi:hypothetical protein
MIEVLKLAAENVSKAYDILAFGHTERALELLAKTRTSLRQAIAELENQEPVAHMYPDDLEKFQTDETFAYAYSVEMGSPTKGETVPLYTTPPQRTWMGLTDEIPKGVLLAISNAGLTLLKTQHGYELRKLGPAVANGIKE